MKTYLKKALALSQTLLLFAGIAGCAGNSTEEYDETKYHLYISAYDAGYGRAWLEMYEKEFEERYTDYTFNDGSDKKGVDVHLDWNQLNAQGLITSMKGSQNQIYFNSVDYYDLVVSDNALDLTAILNEDMADVGEAGNTVLKKIPEDMKEYYGSVRKGKYYGVPSTETWDGINYDKDLFRTKRLYLASEWNDSVSVFTSGEDGDLLKSKGPDDIAGTYDDGLPATISQFYDLLNQMTNVAGVTPFTFSANLGYAEMLPMALWANFEGKEQMQLNFSLKGEAKDLITVSADGKVTQDAAPTAINDSNAYELTRQQGIYRALKVVEDLVDNNTGKSYFSNSAFAGDQDHIAAQEEYLYSAIEGSPIAFLVEGTYWTAEASGIFNDITNSYGEGDEYSVKKRNLAYMPLPHYDGSRVGEKQTIVSGTLPCVAKAGQTDSDYDLTRLFIKFVNTDDMIYNYLESAGYPRGVNAVREMNAEEKTLITPYAVSLLEAQQNSDILHDVSTNPLWVRNASGTLRFRTNRNGWCFRMNTTYQQPVRNMYNDGNGLITAYSFFNGMYSTMKNDWSRLK